MQPDETAPQEEILTKAYVVELKYLVKEAPDPLTAQLYVLRGDVDTPFSTFAEEVAPV